MVFSLKLAVQNFDKPPAFADTAKAFAGPSLE
jgi:hypothetical protein